MHKPKVLEVELKFPNLENSKNESSEGGFIISLCGSGK